MLHTHNDLEFSYPSLVPADGWHCSHFFYRFDRLRLAQMTEKELAAGKQQFVEILEPKEADRPLRLQIGFVAGHKADVSLMVLDQDPIKVESVNQALLSSPLGSALIPTDSYVSLTEVSEYVQTVEQFAAKLRDDGEDPTSSAFQTKLKVYEERLAKMNRQRLNPEIPDWPVSCFYPMNKWRLPGANWFQLSASERHQLMSEHARSGIKFAGKVSQLITVGIGLDDWEWGVTLWATNPLHLKQIVYEMRFDQASAKYAEFGSFYTSYILKPTEVLRVCRI
jgi:chlorite dismutase